MPTITGQSSNSTARVTTRRATAQPADAQPTIDPAELAAAQAQTKLATAVIELTAAVLDADSVTDATDRLAEQLATFFDARAVAVGRVRHGGPRCRLVSQSDVSEVRRDSESTRLLEAAFSEAVLDPRKVCLWTRGHVSGAVPQTHVPLAAHWNANVVLSVALAPVEPEDTDSDDEKTEATAVAAVTIIDPPPHRAGEAAQFLAASARPLGTAVETVIEARGRWTSRLRRSFRERGSLLRAVVVSALVSLFIGAMLWPVPYRMSATCLTQPVLRRYVVAPHEGLVERGLAEPGDVVRAGDTLADMDGRDLRWERAGLDAEIAQARKDRDIALAQRDVTEAQSAELNVRRLEARRRVLDRQESELRITAPIDGVVLDASLEEGSSRPVSVGDALYEVGSLSPLRIEAAVDADLWPYVAEGQTVELRFDGLPDEPFTATVQRVRPQLDVRDAQSVLVVDAELANEDGRLRPGLTGAAKIVGQPQPFAWTLFHRAAESARRWLWW